VSSRCWAFSFDNPVVDEKSEPGRARFGISPGRVGKLLSFPYSCFATGELALPFALGGGDGASRSVEVVFLALIKDCFANYSEAHLGAGAAGCLADFPFFLHAF
jgi:hypothetical protein